MPELPDVAGFKRYFDATSLHQVIGDVEVSDARILEGVSKTQLAQRVRGRTFQQTYRHGKHFFAALDGGGMITMHFGMTGELEYYSPDRQERPRYARVIFSFEGGHRLAYISRRMLGRVGVADDMAGYIEAHDLGPDALAKDLDPKKFVERLQGHRGPIKSTLMNQQIIAGIGNEWGDEILYQAKLHPEAASDELDANRLKKLYRVMRRVLKTGARHGGDAGKLPRRYLLVHRDEGRCPACGARTEKVKVGGRSSYFCPKCQTK